MNNNFRNFALSDALLKATDMLSYNTPTEVQNRTIPAILAKKDVIIKSRTGSGKTASFAIPLCELVDWDDKDVQALVLTPTRELASQVKEDIFHIGRFKRIKVSGLYGGESYVRQVKELKQKTHIAVGTPGRILDHLSRNTLTTSNIKFLIIDEADEMLNMGFIDEVEAIIKQLPEDRVTILLSATMDAKINNIINAHMRNPIRVEINEDVSDTSHITYAFYRAEETGKEELLRDITILENPDSCIIFCNTQVAVEGIDKFLYENGYSCNRIHGGMEQSDRTSIMQSFKRNELRYLIATDVAARGIDVDDISLIINYDMPKKQESFVHRTGRTGRNGKSGKAISFVSERDQLSFELTTEYLGLKKMLLDPPDRDVIAQLRENFEEKSKIPLELKEGKGAILSQDIMKIHINAGRKTKMRAVDIVGTLCSVEGMTAQDIGIINIIDISTFVEILNGKGPAVLTALQTKHIKGRLRRVTIKEDETIQTYP